MLMTTPWFDLPANLVLGRCKTLGLERLAEAIVRALPVREDVGTSTAAGGGSVISRA